MAGMSGSDIKEACRDAAMVPVREFIRQKKASGARMDAVNPNDVRGLRTADFFGSAGGVQVQTVAVGEAMKSREKGMDEESLRGADTEEYELAD